MGEGQGRVFSSKYWSTKVRSRSSREVEDVETMRSGSHIAKISILTGVTGSRLVALTLQKPRRRGNPVQRFNRSLLTSQQAMDRSIEVAWRVPGSVNIVIRAVAQLL